MPLQLPMQLQRNTPAASVTFARVPAAQSVVSRLHLPFTADVTVHVALVALPQVPALQVNVADPPRQEAAFVRFTLAPAMVVVAVAEQPLPHCSVSSSHPGGGQGGPVQDCVSRSAGLSSAGQALLSHGQLTVRVRI